MRVLVADDEATVRLVVKSAVEKLGHECVVAEDGDRAWTLLQESGFDVLITDWMMPGPDGPELCRRLRSHQTEAYTYIILATTLSERADILSGMQAGADDYLIKPLDPFDVRTRLIAAERVTGLHHQLTEEFHGQLAHQALHDPLTGLPNRLMLIDRLDQALARVRRHDAMFGLLFIDLDRFKSVNDTLGHTVGDHLLIEAASRIQAAVRETDTVARLGGDEFIVLCEGIDGAHHATDFALRIIAAVEAPFRVDENDLHVSASIGIALSIDGTETTDSLLANADIAMYRAKDNGRGRCELFDQAMQQWVTTRVAVEAALRQALPRDELRLYCQPIVDTNTRVIQTFEALVRWERPGFGLVTPDTFIPVAEETGLIVDIGAWVLEQACRHAANWAQEWPQRRIDISVNVSGRQLRSGNILHVVTTTLAHTGLDPTLLTLELTESTLIDDAITVQPLLRELRALGVNLALDDFGTGYSSLTHLRAFPINILKIDKSFIREIGTEQEDTAIVAGVIALAKNLGLSVVAEGVETSEQLTVLHQLACPHAQGYLFAHPKPIHHATNLLETPTLSPARTDSPTSPIAAHLPS